MALEPLLAPFTDKGKEVCSRFFWNWYWDWKTETGRAVWDQWKPDVWPVQTAPFLLHLATRGCPSKKLQSVCSPEACLHGRRGSGFQSEMAGLGGSRGVTASEKEAGWGRVWCRVWVEWVGWKENWGWRQEVSFALEEIRELLREQNGHLKRIYQGLDGGLVAGDKDEDSTMRE